jgi:hypothetical protein
MNAAAQLTLDALSAPPERLDEYSALLESACSKAPPPFGEAWYGDRYRDVACDPDWLAQSLIANAQKEGDGARKLWVLAGRAKDASLAEKVRLHAIDESRHSALYLMMLDITFPGAVGDELRALLSTIPPRYTLNDRPPDLPEESDEHVLDELVQMNIGEIRTRIHQLLLRPVITAHCREKARPKLKRILDSILRDETKHIRYTAHLLEDSISSGRKAFVVRTMHRRLADFNDITLQEVGQPSFD